MSKNIYIKSVMYILFALFFMQAFVFPIVFFKSFVIRYALLVLILLLLYFVFVTPKTLYKWIKQIVHFSAIQIFIVYIIWLIINSIIHVFIGNGSIIKSFLSILANTIEVILPLFFGFILTKLLKLKDLIKYTYTILFYIFFIGLLNYILNITGSPILQCFFNIILNKRYILSNGAGLFLYIDRIQSVFEEPGFYGRFIILLLPMIYQFSLSKYRIYKINFINKFMKLLMPLFAWLSILGTRSPIVLVLGGIITLLYIVKRYNLVKNWVMGIFSSLLFIILMILLARWFMNASFDDNYLVRIQKFIMSCTDIGTLVLVEPSLANRIVTYINCFYLFLQHPFIGCGTGNLISSFWHQLLDSPVPITGELMSGIINNSQTMNPSIFFQILAQTGIISIILLYAFYFKIYQYTSQILKLFSSIQYDFIYGLHLFLLINILISFYDSSYTMPYPIIFMGIVLGIKYNISVVKKKRIIKNES